MLDKIPSLERNQVMQFIRRKLHKFSDDPTDATPLGERGIGLDSLAILDLELDLEREYSMEIPANKDFETVGELVNYVIENLIVYKS